MRKGLLVLAALCTTALAQPALAGSVLIINGASGTSEPSTTGSITTQISTLHEAVGNTVTVADGVPTDLSGYAQVWDLRFSNNFALSTDTQNQYVSYLAGGGGMFIMGENSFFTARNDSILSLIALAGGGSLDYFDGSDSQVVYAPFTGPNPVTNIQYSAAGGVTGFGTGQWITSVADGSSGAGVAFGVGRLANAKAGALTTIFDVNFLQTSANAESQALTRNLIGFIGDQVDPQPAVPEPASWAMMIGGLGVAGAGLRRRRYAKVRTSVAYA